MEDFLSLVVFVIVFVVSIISKLKKSNESKQTTSPQSGQQKARGSNLRDILNTIQDEIQQATSLSPESESHNYDNEPVYDSHESYDLHETYDTLGTFDENETYDTGLKIENDDPSEERITPSRRKVNRNRLREAIVWREILDKPVSLR